MSFALTEQQVINQTKMVTRRMGWAFLRPGDLVQPVRKCMGLKKGEKQVKIGPPIEIISVRRESLMSITHEDVALEGFPNMGKTAFVTFFAQHNKCHLADEITRIAFVYRNDLK